jgi:hypothetical protein
MVAAMTILRRFLFNRESPLFSGDRILMNFRMRKDCYGHSNKPNHRRSMRYQLRSAQSADLNCQCFFIFHIQDLN